MDHLNSFSAKHSLGVKAFDKKLEENTEAGEEMVDRQIGGQGRPVGGQSGGHERQVSGEGESVGGSEGVENADGANPSKRHSGGHTASPTRRKSVENLEDCMKGLMISQMRESPMYVEEGIMTLLRRTLAASPKGASVVVVGGNLDHFASKQDVDIGWGCGWRNIQMLASYLISEDPEVREVLFGSAGYVPDIPALQKWLEIAWAKGFDVPGGEYFDWKIKGTNKWIGTTEGAALFRSFGVRARIADFQATGGKRKSPNELRSKTGTEDNESAKRGEENEEESSGNAENEDLEPRETATDNGGHEIECIVCSEHKVQDPEFRRENEGSSMCPHCMKRLQDSRNTDQENPTNEEETQITGRQREGWDDKTGCGDIELGHVTTKHQKLVEWVWKYFMSETVESNLSKSMRLSQRSPIYFQHRGHSQTIVGIERRKVSTSPESEEMNLLVLDPSEKTMDIVESLRSDRGWEILVKRGLQTLKQTEYQLCYCERGLAKDKELENLKILTSRSYTY